MDHNLFTIIPRDQHFILLSQPVKAHAFYRDYSIDLITGKKSSVSFSDWMLSLNIPYKETINEKRVFHLFYEAGYLFEELNEKVGAEDILALDIFYSAMENVQKKQPWKDLQLKLLSAPSVLDYNQKFSKGYEELKKGNCYQFNLTAEYLYSFPADVQGMDFINTLWKNKEDTGKEAIATYVESLGKLYLSNSPECLFEIENEKLISKPIKGTVLLEKGDSESIESQWNDLVSDKKSQAELFMITDLIRNDLNRIDEPVAVVEKKKAMLLVPRLMHQYSEISLRLKKDQFLKTIIEKIFPGGSITGAPKRKVMHLLSGLEQRKRGFYCGSSVTFLNDKISASINIRSCEIDFKTHQLSYQCGGGITLLSTAESEYKEMSYKHDSFIQCLNP